MNGEGNTPSEYTPRARALIAAMVVTGMSALFLGILQFESSEPVRFLSYLVLAVLAAGLRVDLPTLSGTLSINFLFILIGLVELTLSEVLVIGTAMTLVQCLLPQPRRPIFVKTIFNVSVVVLAIFGTAMLYYYQPVRDLGMNQAVLLMFASVVLFLFVTVPVATAMAWTEGREVLATWRECNLWSLPYYLAGAAIAGVFTTLTHSIGWQLALLLIPIIYLMVRSYQLYVARVDDSLQHAEQMAGLHLRTIEALALAIEAKDQTTADHLERVQTYAVEIGKDMNLPYEQLEAIRAAALLHDIGKLAVPEHILSKPGKLTPEEFDKMKIHPIVGAEIIERAEFPYPVAPIVRSHHERWNGEGYPDGLVGTDIPIGARILSAVDCLDALSTDRQYRRALPLQEAMEFVRGESGKAFDPDVVEILYRRYEQLEQIVKSRKGSIKELTTNIKVTRGRPAAGFAESSTPPVPKSKHQQQAQKLTFLDTIAAARQEVQTLFELSKDLGSSLSLEETLSLLATRIKRLVPYDAIAIYFLQNEELVPKFVAGESFRLFSDLRIPYGQGLSGWVAERRQPILNGNPTVEPAYLNDPNCVTALRSALAVPLEGLNQNVVGVLTLYHNDKDFFSKDHLRVLNAISTKISNSIENAMKFEMAETSATIDYLTGLPNARSLFQHLEVEIHRCQRANQPLEVVVCDLNGFKAINDRFGHLEGNKVLREVADHFKDNFRDYDYIARMGGDEFVLVLPGAQHGNGAIRAAQLSQLAAVAGYKVTGANLLSCAVGIARYPEDGADAEALISTADQRMYREKHEFKQLEKSRAEAAQDDGMRRWQEPRQAGTGSSTFAKT